MAAFLYKDETYKILGACFEVYKQLGCGFLETVYHEALAIEFMSRGIPYVSRQPISIYYSGVVLTTGYAPDFVLYQKIVLEIKSCETLCDKHRAQTLNYVKATGLELGLLVNFGYYPKLQHERFACTSGRFSRTAEDAE